MSTPNITIVEEYLRINKATKYDDLNISTTHIPTGWQYLEQSGETDDALGYFGRVYQKGNLLVIASRGSTDTADEKQYNYIPTKLYNAFTDYILNNVHGVYFFRGPYQINSAEEFYLRINATYGSHHDIILTGFSLGGIISTVLCHKYDLSCVVFDTSGDLEIKQNLGLEHKHNTQLTVIQSAPNIVNTHGTHSIAPFYINVPYNPKIQNLVDFFIETPNIHNMDTMLYHLTKGLNRASYWPKIEEAFNNFIFMRYMPLSTKWKNIAIYAKDIEDYFTDITKSKKFCAKIKQDAQSLTHALTEKCNLASEYCDEFMTFLESKTIDNVYFSTAVEIYKAVSESISDFFTTYKISGEDNNNTPN